MLDEKSKVVLGGLPQLIHIKSENEANPVLLFLHGGPGVVNRHAVFSYGELLSCFTLVGWDQRGSGGSYKGSPVEKLKVERFVDDAHELTVYLCERFKKDKIFVIGGSWGSALGTLLCHKYPDNIAAYVGFGQFVDGEKNEEISYEFALNEAKKAKDNASVATLERIGKPVGGVYKGGFDAMMAQRKVMMKYGGYSKSEEKRDYFNSMVVPMLKSGEYTFGELWGVIRGYKIVLKAMWDEVAGLNFPRDIREIKVPYFVFDGRLDYNTPAQLVEDWFNELTAPVKELIWL